MQDRIEKTVLIDAPVGRVWTALTDHKEFGTWFRVALDGPFRPGEVSTGWITHPGYEHVRWNATVKAMKKPSYFSMSWHPYAIDPDKDYSEEPEMLVEFTLAEEGKGTRVTVVESGFSKLPANRRDEAFRMNESGWEAQMKNIKAHVER